MLKIKLKIILIFLFVIVLIFVVWQALGFFQLKGEFLISTDKGEYKKEESLIVKIENKTNKNICFSSCYPYYLERKNGEWKAYPYEECQKTDLVRDCIKAGETKLFQIENLSYAKEGLHRLKIPVCIDCQLVEFFKEEKKFYSNKFSIK